MNPSQGESVERRSTAEDPSPMSYRSLPLSGIAKFNPLDWRCAGGIFLLALMLSAAAIFASPKTREQARQPDASPAAPPSTVTATRSPSVDWANDATIDRNLVRAKRVPVIVRPTSFNLESTNPLSNTTKTRRPTPDSATLARSTVASTTNSPRGGSCKPCNAETGAEKVISDVAKIDLRKGKSSQETAAVCKDGTCPAGDAPRDNSTRYGTVVDWQKDARTAAKLAGQQDKLVFLMQVSGNFARQEFT